MEELLQRGRGAARGWQPEMHLQRHSNKTGGQVTTDLRGNSQLIMLGVAERLPRTARGVCLFYQFLGHLFKTHAN